MRRVKELDSLRGLAALAIVIYHLWLIEYGLLGAAVDLFFVLSGFLITSILLSHRIDGKFLVAFYARRALRIWPIYYLSLAALVLINPFTPTPGPLDGLGYYACFLQNLPQYWSHSAPAFIPAFRHTWSLAIEEQFYIIWPAVLCLIPRRGIPWAVAGLIGLALVARALGLNPWLLATHCDGLALGSLLAVLFRAPEPGGRPIAERFPFAAVGAMAAAFWVGGAVALKVLPQAWGAAVVPAVQGTRLFALNLVFFALVGLVTRNAGRPSLAFLRGPALGFLGQISYGLYLYHHIVFLIWDDEAARLGISQGIGHDLAKAALSFGIAALSWRLIERPLLGLKDRFRYAAGTEGQDAGVPAAAIPRPRALVARLGTDPATT